MDDRLIEATWGGVNKALVSKLASYTDSLEDNIRLGRGLLLYGGTGTGKSCAAGLCMRASLALEHLETQRWYAFADLMVELENPYERNTILRRVSRSSFLVIDDFGTAAMSKQHDQWLDQIVDSRYRKRLATVVTTNIDPPDILKAWPRTGDRWKQNMYAIGFGGKTQRVRTN